MGFLFAGYGVFQVITGRGWNRGLPTTGFQAVTGGLLLILIGLVYLYSLFTFYRYIDDKNSK